MSGDNSNPTNIIDEILQASTHYDVLGVDDMSMDTASLRKAYLRRSVKVHPDKNPDERAQEAFQRVAQAWQILSDDTSRAQYDQALRQGRANMNQDYSSTENGEGSHSQTYYAGPPPSMQESLFVFATVVGSMMGGKTVGNLSEALFWAEKLMRQTERRGLAGDNSDTNEMTNGEKATLAMALGSGLKVASSAARSLGMSGASEKLDQTARLAQMAGVGLMVAEQPAVKQLLQSESLQKLKGGIHAVRAIWGQQQQQQKDSAATTNARNHY